MIHSPLTLLNKLNKEQEVQECPQGPADDARKVEQTR